jgi:hypothetical protein
VHNIFSPLKVLDGKFQTDDVVFMHAYPLLPAMGLACPGIDARLHRMGLVIHAVSFPYYRLRPVSWVSSELVLVHIPWNYFFPTMSAQLASLFET